MSTQQLRAATQAQKEPRGFLETVERMKPEIARALPKHLNPDRMIRIAITEFRKQPNLEKCNPRSVFGAIITLSQLGLEPGVMGQAWLIPYGTECQGIPGWKGLADLVARAGRASVWTGAVYEGDHFEYALGDRPFLTHRPNDEGDSAPGVEQLKYCYAIGRIKGAEWPVIEVWSKAKITKHRDRFNKVGAKHYSFQHFEMYGRKIPLLQVIKYMPASVELQQAMDLEDSVSAGQTIDLAQAASGSWVPAGDGDADGTAGAAGSVDRGAGKTGTEPKYTTQSAIEAIKATKTDKELDGLADDIAADFKKFDKEFPREVEAAINDRVESLKQI